MLHKTTRTLAILATALLTACSTPSPKAIATTQETSVMAPGDHKIVNPALSAEEISKRFLKLLGNIKSRSDLSVETIKESTGLTLEIDGKNAGYLSTDFGNGWRYKLVYIGESPAVLRGVGLYLVNREESESMAPVCTFNFDDYHHALKAMGYDDTPIYGEIGQLMDWRYYKNDITLSIRLRELTPRGHEGRPQNCVVFIGTLN
ncbi:hypothetical protein [Dyella koreensis]|uniref:Lipoprotein n=1 Tax=Dyella koreensis TaxID=311235 RepID=A0ABW8K589_9GAMM